MNLTFIMTGNKSTLENTFSPPIYLDPNKLYEIGLVDFVTYNSIPNVDESNNSIHFIGKNNIDETIESTLIIPEGVYELEAIEKYVQEELGEMEFQLKPNNNTLKCRLKCGYEVDFKADRSIRSLLGFIPQILTANIWHESELAVNIMRVNLIRIECNISSGCYINGETAHTIFAFSPNVPPGYKMALSPQTVIYNILNTSTIDHIRLNIVDQDGHLVNFGGEEVSVRLHIKEKNG